mgnify:CR=1 FL=1
MEPCPRCALHEASPAPCCEDAAAETAQAEAETLHACCCRHKKRSEEEYKSLIHRLNRIEGQIRGIRSMVEKDVYCTDILVQSAAAAAAIKAFERDLLAEHIRSCVAEDIREGRDEIIDELVETLQKLMK